MLKIPATGSEIRFSSRWGWIAFFLFLILPLYTIAGIVCFRSGLFRFNGTLSDTQLKSVWTFLGAGLAAAATVLGGLLTKSHNDRTLALQYETQKQQEIQESEANERLKMDTVISGLKLICNNGTYSPKAAIAGGLATLVQLGHPIVAMRALAAALPEDVVDNDTATWLISEVLTTQITMGTPRDLSVAKDEASSLLYKYSSELTISSSDSAEFSWPGAVTQQWPSGLSQKAGLLLIAALAELLISQSDEWWNSKGQTSSWILYTLDEVLRHEKDPTVKVAAAMLGKAILEASHDDYFVGINDDRDREEIARDIDHVNIPENVPTVEDLVDRIEKWGQARRAPFGPGLWPGPRRQARWVGRGSARKGGPRRCFLRSG